MRKVRVAEQQIIVVLKFVEARITGKVVYREA